MKIKSKEENNDSKFFYFMFSLFFIFFIIFIVGIIGFINRKPVILNDVQNGGNVVLNYTNNIAGFSIRNASPTIDDLGKKNDIEGEYFDFSVSVSLDDAPSIEYEISAEKNTSSSTISNDDIRIYLEREKSGSYVSVFGPSKFSPISENTSLGSKKGSMVLSKIKRKKNTTDNYRLRMWLSDKSLLTSGNYSVNIVVNGKAK